MNPIEAYKYWLQDHLDDLKESCPAKKTELNELYGRVTMLFEESISKSLAAGNNEAQALAEQLMSIQDQVTRDIEHFEDVAGIINKIGMGVGIATRLAGFLAPAITR
jgi:hypothetical protein